MKFDRIRFRILLCFRRDAEGRGITVTFSERNTPEIHHIIYTSDKSPVYYLIKLL